MRFQRVLFSVITVMLMIFVTACSSTTSMSNKGSEATTTQSSAGKESKKLIRFGVGPLLPTAEETKKAYTPFFSYLAKELGYENFEVQATTDWAGIGVALASHQVDVAWVGPWGYVLAHDRDPGINPVATVKYDGKPTYYAIMVANKNSNIQKFPDDAKGKSISLADTGSTSGWLIPQFYFKKWGIDTKSYFSVFREGSTHPANEIAVSEGKVDVASDFNRNRDAMIETGHLPADATKVVWQSDPLPNDAIAARPGLDPELTKKLQNLLLNMSVENAKQILPNHYTGFVAADDSSYKIIKDAGIAVGIIKQK